MVISVITLPCKSVAIATWRAYYVYARYKCLYTLQVANESAWLIPVASYMLKEVVNVDKPQHLYTQ